MKYTYQEIVDTLYRDYVVGDYEAGRHPKWGCAYGVRGDSGKRWRTKACCAIGRFIPKRKRYDALLDFSGGVADLAADEPELLEEVFGETSDEDIEFLGSMQECHDLAVDANGIDRIGMGAALKMDCKTFGLEYPGSNT